MKITLRINIKSDNFPWHKTTKMNWKLENGKKKKKEVCAWGFETELPQLNKGGLFFADSYLNSLWDPFGIISIGYAMAVNS